VIVAVISAAGLAVGAYDFARDLASRGPRPAASAREHQAQVLVRQHFEVSGLKVARVRFQVPGKGRSANVIGVRNTPRDCLRVVMGAVLLAALAGRRPAVGRRAGAAARGPSRARAREVGA
jgi:hypothetical protein